MLLDVDEDCFRPDVGLRLALELIHLAQSGRHEWHPGAALLLAAEDYLKTRLATHRLQEPAYEFVRKKFKATAWQTRETHSPLLRPVRIEAAHLEDLIHDLGKPLIVLVEDLFNDGECLMWLARLFERDRILLARQNRWLEVDHSGGSGRLPTVGHAQCLTFRRIARVIMVIDGDINLHGVESEHKEKFHEAETRGGQVYIWPGREMENFLGISLLATGRRNYPQWADAVRALSWPQRSVIDMKYGLPNKSRKIPDQWTPKHDALFADLSEHHRSSLTGPQLDGKGKTWKLPAHERIRTMPATEQDRKDLPPEAEQAIAALLDLIESVL